MPFYRVGRSLILGFALTKLAKEGQINSANLNFKHLRPGLIVHLGALRPNKVQQKHQETEHFANKFKRLLISHREHAEVNQRCASFNIQQKENKRKSDSLCGLTGRFHMQGKSPLVKVFTRCRNTLMHRKTKRIDLVCSCRLPLCPVPSD